MLFPYHVFGTTTDTRGNALTGWQIEVVTMAATPVVVPIYADENDTPIASVSGIANRAKSDAQGNYDFFVEAGTYNLREYDSSGVLKKTLRYVAMGSTGGTTPPVDSVGLFTDLGGITVPAGDNLITTTGYSSLGIGAGTYIADATATAALAIAHPRACKADAAGRRFRLIGDEIHPEQFGATGQVGANDQPAFQAAFDYANAVGITALRCAQSYYELRTPIRVDGLGGLDRAGNLLSTIQPIKFSGVAGKTMLRCLNSTGGTNDTITQTVDGNPWIGPLFFCCPAVSMAWVSLENLEFDGTRTYTAGTSTPQLTHKGFRVQDLPVNAVFMKNVTIRNCGGEIYYLGGNNPNMVQLLEDCEFDGSPQSAFNPGAGGFGYFVRLKAGNSNQNEIAGGRGQTYVDPLFYKLNSMTIMSGAGGAATGYQGGGYTYSYPFREATAAPPWVNFSNARFVDCIQANFGSYARGKLQTVDTQIGLLGFGKLSDIDLEIEAWCDRRQGFEAVGLYGPPTTTTQATNAPVGVFVDRPRNIQVKVTTHRTAQAASNNLEFASILRCYAGLYDANTCRFEIGGDGAAAAVDIIGSPPVGFTWPYVEFGEIGSIDNNYGSGNGVFPSAAFNFTLRPGPNYLDPQAAGTFDMTLVNTYPFADQQRVRIWRSGTTATDRWVKLAKSGAGALLSADRTLYRRSDFLDLRWTAAQALFVEDRYATMQALEFNGTVASLPAAAGLRGLRGTVTDSTATLTAGIGAIVSGGGANVVPVHCDGANWRIG